MAVLEKTAVLPALPYTNVGTVAAGIQNFLICFEMLAAAIALRYAFPHLLYSIGVSTRHHYGEVDGDDDTDVGTGLTSEKCGLMDGNVWKNSDNVVSLGRF